MSHDALRAKLDDALRALPKPVSEEAILETARKTLPAVELGQFQAWFKQTKGHLLTLLNAR